MKIKTTYIPTDAQDKPFTLPGVYTLADIAKLGSDLTAAGITEFDTMNVSLHDGVLTIVTEKATPQAASA